MGGRASAFVWTDGQAEIDPDKDTHETFAAPGPAPRPGLQWKEETHRWVNPHTGEEHVQVNDSDTPKSNHAESHATDIDQAAGQAVYALASQHPELQNDSRALTRLKEATHNAIARGFNFLMDHQGKLGTVLGAVADLPTDLSKLGYEPSVAGVGGTGTADPMRHHLGIGTHAALSLASQAVAQAWKLARGLSGRQMSDADGDVLATAAELVAGLIEAVAAEFGLEGKVDVGKVKEALATMRANGVEG